MKEVNLRSRVRVNAARRVALGLLAALSVVFGTVAMPMAGTASAGGLSGGVIQGR